MLILLFLLILGKRVGERIFVWGEGDEPKLQEKKTKSPRRVIKTGFSSISAYSISWGFLVKSHFLVSLLGRAGAMHQIDYQKCLVQLICTKRSLKIVNLQKIPEI